VAGEQLARRPTLRLYRAARGIDPVRGLNP